MKFEYFKTTEIYYLDNKNIYLYFLTFPEEKEITTTNIDNIENVYEIDKFFIFKHITNKNILYLYHCLDGEFIKIISDVVIDTCFIIFSRFLILSVLNPSTNIFENKIFDINDKIYLVQTNEIELPGFLGINNIILFLNNYISNDNKKNHRVKLKQLNEDKEDDYINNLNLDIKSLHNNSIIKLISNKNNKPYTFITNVKNNGSLNINDNIYKTVLDEIYYIFDFSITEILIYGKKEGKYYYFIININNFEYELYTKFSDLICKLNYSFYNHLNDNFIDI